MSEYPVNRGIGKPVEFKGLKSQYLFIFCGGLLAVFVVFIVTCTEYEAIHSAWNKAIKVLPDYSIVHKQDFFIKENYQLNTCRI